MQSSFIKSSNGNIICKTSEPFRLFQEDLVPRAAIERETEAYFPGNIVARFVSLIHKETGGGSWRMVSWIFMDFHLFISLCTDCKSFTCTSSTSTPSASAQIHFKLPKAPKSEGIKPPARGERLNKRPNWWTMRGGRKEGNVVPPRKLCAIKRGL